jgi:hypothetical protein
LLRARIGQFFTRNQSIGNFLERIQHGGLILQRGLLARGAGLRVLRAKLAAVKERSGQTGGNFPSNIGTAGSESGKFRAGSAEQSREIELREKIRFCHAYLRVGRTQLLLGFADVGPPLQQGGRQTGGNLRRYLFFERRISTQNNAGILPEQNAQLIFL